MPTDAWRDNAVLRLVALEGIKMSKKQTMQESIAIESMQGLLVRIVQAMVHNPAAVTVTPMTTAGTTYLRLSVSPSDMSRIIGQQGRTARAIRVLMNAASTKLEHRFALDIVERQLLT